MDETVPAVAKLAISPQDWASRAKTAVAGGSEAKFVADVNEALGERVVLSDGVHVENVDREVAGILFNAGLIPWEASEEVRVENADLLRWFDLVQTSFGPSGPSWGAPVQILKSASPEVLKKAMLKSVGVDDAEIERIRAEKKAAKAAKQAAKKASKPAKQTAAEKSGAPDDDVSRLDIRVGRITAAKRHPDADGLYVEEIDCGDENARTVCSGLVKFIPEAEQLLGPCLVLCNLKPANMRGIKSEAMVMCATSEDGSEVQLVKPPDGVPAGTRVICAGHEEKPDAQLNPKKKIFEKIAPDLVTNADGVAAWRGIVFSTPAGPCTTTLPNAPIK